MKEPTLGNPQNTIEVLQKYNFVFQKKFGQNFLIDTHVLDKIIAAAEITKDDFVLEIGPGIGTMTQYLAEAAREVVAVEIDTKLIPILEDTLKEYDNVTVLNEDILKETKTIVSKMAKDVSKKINLGFGSIDIIKTIDDKYYVLEINSGVMIENYIKLISDGVKKAKKVYEEAVLEMFK